MVFSMKGRQAVLRELTERYRRAIRAFLMPTTADL